MNGSDQKTPRACGALVFITATGTGSGKTWWGAAIARAVRANDRTIVARKPAQSFAPGDTSTDAEVLAAATGQTPDDVCPPHRCYPVPLAPPMAAEVLGRPAFTLADLETETTWAGAPDIAIVEGAGGPRSPLAGDGDNVGLAHRLRPSLVLLVADAGLGTINAVRLCVDALAPLPVVVGLNRFVESDDLHLRNRLWLSERYGLDVVTRPAPLVDRLLAIRAAPRPGGRPGRGPSSTGTG